MSQYIVQGQI